MHTLYGNGGEIFIGYLQKNIDIGQEINNYSNGCKPLRDFSRGLAP